MPLEVEALHPGPGADASLLHRPAGGGVERLEYIIVGQRILEHIREERVVTFGHDRHGGVVGRLGVLPGYPFHRRRRPCRWRGSTSRRWGLQQPPFLDLPMPMSSPYPFRMWVPA